MVWSTFEETFRFKSYLLLCYEEEIDFERAFCSLDKETTISVETSSRSRRSSQEVDQMERAKKRVTSEICPMHDERNERRASGGYATENPEKKKWTVSGSGIELSNSL